MSSKRNKTWLFDWGALGYDVITGQDFWRSQIRSMLDHARIGPNRRSTRLLDLGCGPGVSTFVLAEKLNAKIQQQV